MSLHDDDAALLSIDFLAGFTVFLLAFIIAASMVPGMLASLQSSSVDYDAVAYRTGVILAEDPGWFKDTDGKTGTNWQSELNSSVKRMGLAVSKDTPGILSAAKVDRFFEKGEDTDYYRDRIFFSDYPYAFNISLKKNGNTPRFVGAPLPQDTTDYGSIRRAVMVKENAPFVINGSNHIVDNNESKTFYVSLNFPAMLEKSEAYRINPYEDTIEVRLENLTGMATDVNFTNLKLNKSTDGEPLTLPLDSRLQDPKYTTLKIDNETKTPNTNQYPMGDNITLILEPGFFIPTLVDPGRTVDIIFTFKNTTSTDSWKYINGTSDYSTMSPTLTPAVLEVAVW